LEGSIIKLLAYASLRHRAITVDVAAEALHDKLRNSRDDARLRSDGGGRSAAGLTVQVIQDAVAKEWGVTADGLKSKTRTKALTTPRQVAMYLCRELLNVQLVEIGNAFGGRDHSTVIHSLDRVATENAASADFSARVENLRSTLDRLR
jgi:chromosomal replication initiator protein